MTDREYAQMATAQAMDRTEAYYGEAATLRVEGTIERLTNRVRGATVQLREIGHKLGAHADAVHGPRPEANGKDGPTPVRSGRIGELEDALDELDRAGSFLAEQAGRNCTLA